MSRNRTNFTLDCVTLGLMLALAFTGLMIRYVLPVGSGGRGGGPGLAVWGLGRHDWGDIHAWLAYALIALVVLHVALHWRWVCSTVGLSRTTNSPRGRALFGVGFCVVLSLTVLGIIWLAAAGVVQAPGRRGQPTALVDPPARLTTTPAERPATPSRTSRRAERAHLGLQAIRGQMTLAEAAHAAGIDMARLRTALELPPSVSEHERLGRVRRRLGLEMEELRQRLERASD